MQSELGKLPHAKRTQVFDHLRHMITGYFAWHESNMLNKQTFTMGMLNLLENLKSHSHPFPVDSPIPGHPLVPH